MEKKGAGPYDSDLGQRPQVTVEIFAAGDGMNYPHIGQTVTVHYTGYLATGDFFDSSRDRGKPFKFKLGAAQVIPGLDEGVAQLSIGERAKITIPSQLACVTSEDGRLRASAGAPRGLCAWGAVPHPNRGPQTAGGPTTSTDPRRYGERGFPGLVPRNSGLVFDLELITFN